MFFPSKWIKAQLALNLFIKQISQIIKSVKNFISSIAILEDCVIHFGTIFSASVFIIGIITLSVHCEAYMLQNKFFFIFLNWFLPIIMIVFILSHFQRIFCSQIFLDNYPHRIHNVHLLQYVLHLYLLVLNTKFHLDREDPEGRLHIFLRDKKMEVGIFFRLLLCRVFLVPLLLLMLL